MPHFGLENVIPPILYCVAIVVFFLSAFVRPQIGLYFIIPLMPLQNVRYKLHDYPLGEKLIDLMLLGVLLGLALRGQKIFQKTKLNMLFLVLAVFTYAWLWKGSLSASMSLPLSIDNPRVSNWKNNILVPIILFFAVYAAINTTKRIKILLVVMCLGILAMNRDVRRSLVGRDYSTFSYQTRVNAGSLNPNSLASLEAQFCFLLLSLQAYEKKKLLKFGYLGLAGFCIYCLVFTLSRGGYVAFAAGWIFLGIVKDRKLLIAMAVFLSAWQIVVPGAVRDRILMTYSEDEGLDHSAAGRLTLWQDAIEAIEQNPLVGSGYETYYYVGSHVEGLRDTHNLYLKILFETGAVGLFLFLALQWKAFQAGYGLFRSAEDPLLVSLGLGFAAWMVCALVGNLFGDRWNFIQLLGYTWALLAMVMRAQVIVHEEAEAAVPKSLPSPASPGPAYLDQQGAATFVE